MLYRISLSCLGWLLKMWRLSRVFDSVPELASLPPCTRCVYEYVNTGALGVRVEAELRAAMTPCQILWSLKTDETSLDWQLLGACGTVLCTQNQITCSLKFGFLY